MFNVIIILSVSVVKEEHYDTIHNHDFEIKKIHEDPKLGISTKNVIKKMKPKIALSTPAPPSSWRPESRWTPGTPPD